MALDREGALPSVAYFVFRNRLRSDMTAKIRPRQPYYDPNYNPFLRDMDMPSGCSTNPAQQAHRHQRRPRLRSGQAAAPSRSFQAQPRRRTRVKGCRSIRSTRRYPPTRSSAGNFQSILGLVGLSPVRSVSPPKSVALHRASYRPI